MKSYDLKSEEHKKEEQKEDNPKKKEKRPVVGYLSLYRFADAWDRFFLVLGFLCAAINGASLPLISRVGGDTVDDFVNSGRLQLLLDRIPAFLQFVNLTSLDVVKDPSKLESECTQIDFFYNTSGSCRDLDLEDPLSDKSKTSSLIYCIFGIVVTFTSLGQVAFFQITSEKQANRIRRRYLANILRQDIGWFDTHDASELNTRLSGDIIKIQSGIADGSGTSVQYMIRFVIGYAIGFANGWKLSLVLVSLSPLLILSAGMLSYAYVFMAAKDQEAYAKAGAIAEEVLSSIRTVVAFGGEEKEAIRYGKHLGEAQKSGNKKGLITGITIGFLAFVTFCTYAMGLWYGGRLIRHDEYAVSDVITVFFSVALGTFALGTSVTGIQSLTEGRGAAYAVFQLIDMKSAIDSSSTDGVIPKTIQGRITFKNVHFSYPSRPDIKVLSGLNVNAQPGQTVAIVGSSGCGKSTLVQLLLRFYDPQKGKILLDGYDIRDINIKWLRQSIGLVSQEPILFDTTIAENISYGREGVSEEEIIQATKLANAYDFITQLPDKFQTMVGERGAQLSGGQKQRIAIARALVRNPKILLLDEATSALDTESESLVQDALDKARQGRTTLVIAHRLSTIKTADIIIGLENGEVQEHGTHGQLMEKPGIYYNLVMNQIQSLEEERVNNEHLHNDLERIQPAVEGERKLRRRKSSMHDSSDLSVIDEDLPEVSSMELLRLNSPEWTFIILGLLGAILHGGSQPAFSFFFSEILNTFSEEDDKQKRDLRKQSLYLVAVGLVSFLGAILQTWMLAISGEALTRRIREDSFRAMLKQEMAWFDKPCNSTGALTNRLATDASLVKEAGGIRLGVLLQCIVGVIASLTLSVYYSWQLTLVTLGFFPLIMLTGVMQMKVIKGNTANTKEALEGASVTAVDAFENMRTVSSLTIEKIFYDSYSRKLGLILDSLYRNSIITGLLFSVSQGVIFFSLAAIFALGAYLIEEGDLDSNDVFKVMVNLLFSALFLGQAASFGPDVNRARAATKRIFYMLKRETRIDADSPNGTKPDERFSNSSIKVHNASFYYPIRPDVKVLDKMDFTVQPGQTVALVGSSGCGKSTVIALLERFYNLKEGTLKIANYDINDLNIRWLRAQIGLVSQEPVLFDSSIADNIAYGDNSRMVPMNEIIDSARQANIHSFIQGLPNGYDTNVGEKGTQLSGGQKQRIAIARALVRKPKILLLDEATSALDTENEKIVQEALDRAREGRTCIVIAHRLSTIQNADNIIVINSGRVVEVGNHEKLMALKGVYSTLQKSKI